MSSVTESIFRFRGRRSFGTLDAVTDGFNLRGKVTLSMIPVAEPWITDRELERVTDAVERGWISPRGDYVTEFEERFAEFAGTEHALATSTGTSALHLSLVAAGVGEGDEVIVPDLTWIACANVVRYAGAKPRFADVEEETYTLDPESVRELVGDETSAVMPVHLYGQPCNMGPILEIAEEHDLFVLEDAAEAHGARYQETPVGGIGDAGCFSFYGNKILTTGQGGMITTDDDELAERIQLYRRDGMSTERKYYHPVVGYNYRLTNIQAAIGVEQVKRAEEILSEKRRVAERYREELSHPDVRFQEEPDWGRSAHWMTAPVFETESQCSRVRKALFQEDIQTRPFFHPLHRQPPYDTDESTSSISVSLAERGLNLPSGPLLSKKQIIDICNIISETL
jgi:perosamine synthetase